MDSHVPRPRTGALFAVSWTQPRAYRSDETRTRLFRQPVAAWRFAQQQLARGYVTRVYRAEVPEWTPVGLPASRSGPSLHTPDPYQGRRP